MENLYEIPEIDLESLDLSPESKNRYLHVLQAIFIDKLKRHDCTEQEIMTVGILRSIALQYPDKLNQKFPELVTLVTYNQNRKVQSIQNETHNLLSKTTIDPLRRLGILANIILFTDTAKNTFKELNLWITELDFHANDVSFDLPCDLVFIESSQWMKHLKSTHETFAKLDSTKQISLILIKVKIALMKNYISFNDQDKIKYPELCNLLSELELKKVAISK